jgi:hypothetical protein
MPFKYSQSQLRSAGSLKNVINVGADSARQASSDLSFLFEKGEVVVPDAKGVANGGTTGVTLTADTETVTTAAGSQTSSSAASARTASNSNNSSNNSSTNSSTNNYSNNASASESETANNSHSNNLQQLRREYASRICDRGLHGEPRVAQGDCTKSPKFGADLSESEPGMLKDEMNEPVLITYK